ncbi:MAG: zf-HC2 domain-containing protein [Candidatus Omnitrophica bacterium]|nr:zf-HC2 domain-containing protein [Candidatus Omnitrophota bacterium]
MKCDDVRRILSEGYKDNGLGEQEKERVHSHLRECPECRQFHLSVEQVFAVLSGAKRSISPPDRVWDKIQVQVSASDDRIGIVALMDVLARSFRALKPLPAIAGAALLILAITSMGYYRAYERSLNENYVKEQIRYLLSAENGEASMSGLGTSIEEFFL